MAAPAPGGLGDGSGFVRGVRSDGGGTLAAVLGQGGEEAGGERGRHSKAAAAAAGAARGGGIALTAVLSPGGTARVLVRPDDDSGDDADPDGDCWGSAVEDDEE